MTYIGGPSGFDQPLNEPTRRALLDLSRKIDSAPAGADGKGWTGGSYNAGTGIVTFTSTDGLGFVTGDLRGAGGYGWTGGSYNAGTGIVTFTSTDGLGFSTGDLRGAQGSAGTDGTGWTGGSYNAGTGIVTFTSTDGLGFSTGDLRGAQGIQGIQGIQGVAGTDGLGWTGGSYNSGTGVVTFTSADGLGFVTGDLRGSVSDPLLLSDGSAGAPTYSFASDSDVGIYRPAANQLGFAAGGVELLRVGSADVDVMTGHLNLISNTGAQTMSLGEWSSGYDYAAVETPSMVVLMGNASDVNSQGFIRTKGTGSLNLGTNNSNDLTIANGGAVSTVGDITAGGYVYAGDAVRTVDGSAGAPSYTFTADTTTGIYRRGTNEIGFSTAGTENLRLTGSNLRMASATSVIYNTGYFRGVAATGTVSSPTFSWDGDSQTGMYRAAAETIGWALGGVRKMQLSPDRLYLWGGTNVTSYIGPINTNYFFMSTGSNAFYFNKGVRVDTGVIGSHNENLQLARAGTTKMTMTTTHNISNQKFKIDGPNVGTAAKSWTSSQFLIESLNSSGSETTNSIVQMAFHNDRYNIAFNVRNFGPEGTTLGFTNSANSAFIPIRASAFTVMSTIRIKQDIEAVEDADAIALAEKFLLTSFLPKVRPENVHLSEQFKAKNAEWIAASPENEELTPEAEDWESHDHDCCTDYCAGDADTPCQVTVNDTRRFGGLAEWWGEVAPEQVNFDGEGIADSIDMDQVATTALGATGALSRKLTAAMEMIDSLQSRLAVLEGLQ